MGFVGISVCPTYDVCVVFSWDVLGVGGNRGRSGGPPVAGMWESQPSSVVRGPYITGVARDPTDGSIDVSISIGLSGGAPAAQSV